MDFNDLTPEQQEMARACKSHEELAELVRSLGYELTEEELAGIAGANLSQTCRTDRLCLHSSRPICPNRFQCPDFSFCPIESCVELLACPDHLLGDCDGYNPPIPVPVPIQCKILSIPTPE